MNGSALADDQQALLVESLRVADRELSKAQAGRAQLMVEFADARKKADRHRIRELESSGGECRYRPGEFAATEIGLAVTATRRTVQLEVAMTRRLQAEAPDAWDAWIAGDINQPKAAQIGRILLRLVRDDSKKLLNMLVVPVAIEKTPELLRRWLNRFVARVEPEEVDERIRRSLEDRYVSVRPDLDGVSFLSACMSSLDAASVDLMLDALAGIAEPGDSRTKQQRRADVLVDLLMGRISNGWQPGEGEWEPDDIDEVGDGDQQHADGGGGGEFDESADGPTGPHAIGEGGCADSAVDETGGADRGPDRAWDEDDWDLPATAFRPDPTAEESADPIDENKIEEPVEAGDPDGDRDGDRDGGSGGPAAGAPVDCATSCAPRPGERVGVSGGTGRPPPRVTIGVVVSIQSLFGLTDTPGELADGSAHVPASVIRELAGQPGTLFHRLLTDPTGNLLDVTELGRFPSRRLAAAVRFRDGVCSNPICHVGAHRCDLDHVVPYPDGPTAGINLDPKCRGDHRAKTHAGFTTTLAGGQAIWTTPTGHRYTAATDPLPVEPWPHDSG